MGEVFRGIDTGLNRRVAIKILSEKHRDSPELRARFVREGKAVAAINHPNVVQVFATGIFDERPYIAMELLDGTDLGSTVEKRGALDSIAAAHAVLDAAQGLAAAAKAGLIHRDVKPSNLVRIADGKVKVTDFGLAKPTDPGAEPALTAMGVVVGTPDYIAPEQARGEAIDERVDIYALGGTLYFILTGTPPFRTGKPSEDKYLKVVARHLRNPPPDATAVNPAVDHELAELVRLMMSKKPAERPSYDELVARLTQVLARLDPDAVPQLIASRERSRPNIIPGYKNPRAPSLDDSATISDGGSLAAELPRRAFPVWLILFTVLCLAFFVTGLVIYLRRGTGEVSGSLAAPVDTDSVVVTKPDGSKLKVDLAPITAATFHQFDTKHVQPGNPDDPVINVSYTMARSYVKSHGGRLLSSEDWELASVTKGYVLPDGMFEWVDSPDASTLTVRARALVNRRPDAEQKDVTFRMARSL